MSDPVNLFAQQEANRRRSRWLVFWFVLFFAWLGFGGDAIRYYMVKNAHPDQPAAFFPLFGVVMTLVAGGFAWSAWRNGPKRVLDSTGAREVIDPQTPEEKQLVNVVEEMAVASGIPKPRVLDHPRRGSERLRDRTRRERREPRGHAGAPHHRQPR